MLSDSDVEFVDRRYGKNFVKLLHVRREGQRHFIKEIEVNTKLTLASTKDFVSGDNSDIIATDSQKNTVYVLAKQHGIRTIEEFGMQLSGHFLKQYPHVTAARIYVEEHPWRRIEQGGREHAHAFLATGDGTRFCEVEQFRQSGPRVSGGIKDLKILKTTKSAFVNFVRDEYRSLPDMEDRIFCTIVQATWKYGSVQGLDFDRASSEVKDSILYQFAGPSDTGLYSPSVQKTLYDAQKMAMARVPQINEIDIELPNVHAYEYDFSKFPALGLRNGGEVFQPTDKPSGNIRATIKRKYSAKL